MTDDKPQAPAQLITRRFQHYPVRLVMRDGRPWWIAKDLLAILHNHQRAPLARLADRHKRRIEVIVGRGPVLVVCVAEQGVRALIATSRAARKEAFELWFDEEHLPLLGLTPETAPADANTHQYEQPAEEDRTMTTKQDRPKLIVTPEMEAKRHQQLTAKIEAMAKPPSDPIGDRTEKRPTAPAEPSRDDAPTALIPFSFEGRPFRIVDEHGGHWIIAADVCHALELAGDAGQHLRRLDDDEKRKAPSTLILNQGGPDIWLINESGFYSLVLRSDKPVAKRLRKWVTTEVLPALARTGRYEMPGAAVEPAPGLSVEEEERWFRRMEFALKIADERAARALWKQSPLPQWDTAPPSSTPARSPATATARGNRGQFAKAALGADEQALVDRYLAAATRRDPAASVLCVDLHRDFLAWCVRNGEPPLDVARFSKGVYRHGLAKARHPRRHWIGLALPNGTAGAVH